MPEPSTRIRLLLLVLAGAALPSAGAAADYYVKPQKPGPIVMAPLAEIPLLPAGAYPAPASPPASPPASTVPEPAASPPAANPSAAPSATPPSGSTATAIPTPAATKAPPPTSEKRVRARTRAPDTAAPGTGGRSAASSPTRRTAAAASPTRRTAAASPTRRTAANNGSTAASAEATRRASATRSATARPKRQAGATTASAPVSTPVSAPASTPVSAPVSAPVNPPPVNPPTGTAAAPSAPDLLVAPGAKPPGPEEGVYPSLDALLKAGVLKGGDRVFLMDGYHGPIFVRDLAADSPIVIAPAPGAVVHADTIRVMKSRNVVFKNIKVWPTDDTPHDEAGIVRTYSTSEGIAFDGLDMRSHPDAPNYGEWPLDTWLSNKRRGAYLDGPSMTISNSRVTGLYHGIWLAGANGLAENNIVDGFSGDAIRGTHQYATYRGNRVQNCIHIGDTMHRDGFQPYATAASGSNYQQGLVVENNQVYEWNRPEANPLRCSLQGIGLFGVPDGGGYFGARIENNLIVVDNEIGIVMYAAHRSVILHNTVIDARPGSGKTPKISIEPNWIKEPWSDVTMANNLAPDIVRKTAATGTGTVTQDRTPGPNVLITSYASVFADPSALDFTLKSGSPAVDAGLPEFSTAADIRGTARFIGRAPDAGAFESR